MVNKKLSYGRKIEQKIKVSGLKFIGKPHLERGYLFDEIWTAHFGAAFEVCVRVWKMMIVDGLDDGLEIRHFVWSLYFLKNYPFGRVAAAKADVDRKTFRKYVKLFIESMSMLESRVVSVFYI